MFPQIENRKACDAAVCRHFQARMGSAAPLESDYGLRIARRKLRIESALCLKTAKKFNK